MRWDLCCESVSTLIRMRLEDGWEPFAVEAGSVWFRKQVEAKP